MKKLPLLFLMLITYQKSFAGSCWAPAPITAYPCWHNPSNLPYPSGIVTVSILDFGAIPDDGLNDQWAFEAASDFIQNNSAGSGNVTLLIPKGVYDVGAEQYNCGPYLFGRPIIQLRNCTGVNILGEPGTVLKYVNCLDYGSFDKATGDRYLPYPPDRSCGQAGFNDWAYAAYPNNCIDLTNCEKIIISNLELDGNINGTTIGGSFAADFANIQLPFDGLYLNDCRTIDLYSLNVHDFGRDGIMINGSVTSPYIGLQMYECSFNRNCRNGFSWGSGEGVDAWFCNFNENGQTKLSSPMRAGIDIEWEFGCAPADGHFNLCNMQHNKVYGIIAGQNYWEVNNINFYKCEIYAAEDHYNWNSSVASTFAVRAEARDMNFNGCVICGSISRVYTGAISNGLDDETEFYETLFKPWDNMGQLVTDDNGCLLDWEIAENATFNLCTFYRSNKVGFLKLAGTVGVRFYTCNFYDYSSHTWNGNMNSLPSLLLNNTLFTQPGRTWLVPPFPNDGAKFPPCFTVTNNISASQQVNYPPYLNANVGTIDLFCYSCDACNTPLPYETKDGKCSEKEPWPHDIGRLAKPDANTNNNDFNIYPNPGYDNININGLTEISKVVITDMMNRVVVEVMNKKNIDISSLAKGMYVVRVNNNYTKVFVKE